MSEASRQYQTRDVKSKPSAARKSPTREAAVREAATAAVRRTGSRSGKVHAPGSGAWDRVSYGAIFNEPLIGQSQIVRDGLPPIVFKRLARDMGVDQTTLIAHLGLARSTMLRKIKNQSPLGMHESERVLGMALLVGQVQTMVDQSGDAAGFDAAAWVGEWIESPLPALGNLPPAQFMDTAAGQQLVSRLLAQAQSGAFA